MFWGESRGKGKKVGFPTPVREWITKERTNVILENPYIKSHFDVAKIEELISDHISKRTDNSRKIYLLLMLALWYNVFIENSKLKIEN